ncbi:MAG: hypothetical protein A2504_03850 [Bdellovibrionales bacterium RIFOXYD12_FULL_39_22]|nr:MAG: hypothetical protein A2385_11600 [Bdellovibrionales bacterium RIFOXYB1_FULL_39_21]OFZ41710.1 MAG: hypothetical protein A2485_01910 [Bdellovibrionales bacterium RIFOXYC12_FULL_39_17]OFZ46110.1 MAG: hypothetical protein A2404_12275 [Bdellovibrionales bacterium RIFOXYC1_FULL_39_130]OFZ74937.1 MAG: hypothetical protein A2560_15315 [Bdellovibrionales bacterium RIFOXYD1_FULL_39_84]OFZ92790.1 MAG: hypothetical protein A2504_03850 [Bdellovibrionales bacterium RIFOXYD12_FULL_39_22]HLE12579.1 ly
MLLIVRAIAISLYMAIISIPVIIISFFVPFRPINNWIYAKLFAVASTKILGLHFIIEGEEHLQCKTSSILISNHQENLDIVALAQIVPRNFITLGKQSLFFLPLFGLYYWLSGNILINRSNRTKAIQAMNHIRDSLKNKYLSIFIFPEGTRNHGKGMGPFKKGAFHTAIDAQVPIIPICLSSHHKNLRLGAWRTGTIIIKILSPIYTAGMAKDDLSSLMENTRKLMIETIDDLDQRLSQQSKNGPI